jgi:hypothetical protein
MGKNPKGRSDSTRVKKDLPAWTKGPIDKYSDGTSTTKKYSGPKPLNNFSQKKSGTGGATRPQTWNPGTVLYFGKKKKK